jgi:beta-galactosidase
MAAMFMMMRSSTWPWYQAYCGDIDITGEGKPQKAYRDVLWNISKLEMNVHSPIPEGMTERIAMWGWPDEWPCWNWKGHEGALLQVRVFTKATHVRLELNNKVIGEKDLLPGDKYIAVFEVPYQEGTLKAIATEKGNETATKILETTGRPVAIKLNADRTEVKSDRNDLSFVTIEAVDEKGRVVPDAAVKVRLNLSGDGELVASGNGSPDGMESFNKPVISTYKGKAQAILRPFAKAGSMVLKAESEGLESSELKITSR